MTGSSRSISPQTSTTARSRSSAPWFASPSKSCAPTWTRRRTPSGSRSTVTAARRSASRPRHPRRQQRTLHLQSARLTEAAHRHLQSVDMKTFIPKGSVWSLVACSAFALGLMPKGEAVEVLRWERLPLTVSLVVGEERVVFLDQNVRVGVPDAVDGRLRVQSAGGAIYLRANVPIDSVRLQLQDAETGALMLVDVTAVP